MNETFLVDYTNHWTPFLEERTSRKCLVCDGLENPEASIVDTATAWLCPRCKAALLKVVEETQ